MLSDATLERVSVSYRNGYRDGYAGRTNRVPETGLSLIGDDPIAGTLKPFAANDYATGHKAGANDKHWATNRPVATEAQLVASRAARQKTNEWRAANGKPLLPEL